MIFTIRPLLLLVGVAVLAAGCSSTQRDPGQNLPTSTNPASVVVTDGSGTTTTQPSVTSPSAVESTTSIVPKTPNTTRVEVEATDPAASQTTTTNASIETLTPEAETFEPETPQTGFVTYEPNA